MSSKQWVGDQMYIVDEEVQEYIEKLEAKLPRYADTGKVFVPGVDEAWGRNRGRIRRLDCICDYEFDEDGQWMWVDRESEMLVPQFYSTEQAALAAKGGK